MQKKFFGLRTSANAFAHTLYDLTQLVHLRKFPFDSPTGRQGYFSLRPIRLPAGPIGQQPVSLYMRCSYTLEGKPASPEYPEFWAIRFKIVSPAADYISVTAECAHEPVMGYFSQLLKDIGWPFPGSARAVEMTGTGWPDVIQVTRAELEQATAPLPFEPQDVYRHLCALCDHDARFLLGQPKTGDHLEMLAVLDADAVRLAYTAPQATIGIVRLLSLGSGTIIQFTPHDAPFYQGTPARSWARFCHFIYCVRTHFGELARHQIQTRLPPVKSASGVLASMAHNTLDPLDRKIIEVVYCIEDQGLTATDELVARRLPPNPNTGEPYHRVTISRRRNKMRDKGHQV